MDDNKVSVIAVDIIHVANIDIRLKIVEKLSQLNPPYAARCRRRSTRPTHLNILPKLTHLISKRIFFPQDGDSNSLVYPGAWVKEPG